MNDEQHEFFKYLDDLVDEMWELSKRHEALSKMYTLGMERLDIEGPEWRQGYINWTLGRIVDPGYDLCTQCGNMRDTPAHELGCKIGREEYGHDESE